MDNKSPVISIKSRIMRGKQTNSKNYVHCQMCSVSFIKRVRQFTPWKVSDVSDQTFRSKKHKIYALAAAYLFADPTKSWGEWFTRNLKNIRQSAKHAQNFTIQMKTSHSQSIPLFVLMKMDIQIIFLNFESFLKFQLSSKNHLLNNTSSSCIFPIHGSFVSIAHLGHYWSAS